MYIAKPMYATIDASQGGDHVVMSRKNVLAQTKGVPRNVEQLSKGYVVVSVGSPLIFSDIVRPHRASCQRKGRIRTDSLQREPTHQMTLRHTNDLNFNGNVSVVSAEIIPNSQMVTQWERSIPGYVWNEPVRICSVRVGEKSEMMAKPVLKSLSEGSTVEQGKISPSVKLDMELESELELDVERNGVDMEEEIEDMVEMMRMDDVEADWRRRKKLPKCELNQERKGVPCLFVFVFILLFIVRLKGYRHEPASIAITVLGCA